MKKDMSLRSGVWVSLAVSQEIHRTNTRRRQPPRRLLAAQQAPLHLPEPEVVVRRPPRPPHGVESSTHVTHVA